MNTVNGRRQRFCFSIKLITMLQAHQQGGVKENHKKGKRNLWQRHHMMSGI